MMTTAMLVALWAGTASADAFRSNAPDTDVAKARELVKQLGDTKFKVRDAAEKELLQLGLASIDALKEGEKSADLHVQERCRVLQPMIRALTLQKRIDHFLTNRDGPLPKNLPFVDSFIKITGDTKDARQLYAEVLQLNAAMMDEIERDKKKGAELFSVFCQEVTNRTRFVNGGDFKARQQSITRPDVAFYFMMVHELAATPDKTGRTASYGYTFLNAPILPESLAKETDATLPFKKLFLAWLDKESQSYMVQRGLQVAADAKMKEALPLVLKHIKEKSVPIYTRAQTALLLAKIGARDNVKDVEPLLDDKTVVGNFGINNKQGQVQMRDVALAVCIKLSGQKMSEYDFDVMKGNDDLISTSYIYCAFSSSEKRDAAHKKYKDWQDANPKR